jgi:predicted PhzF superfamily epimerase YddE/YHI9
VGKVPVDFREDAGNVFGEMHQVEPVFGPVHDRDTIAALLDLSPSDISSDAPIQSLSTGLFFIIVPIKNLSTLQRLAARSYPDFLIFTTSREILATPRLVCAHEGSSPPAKTPLLGLPPDARRLGWCNTE